jgi:hypothetical protein
VLGSEVLGGNWVLGCFENFLQNLKDPDDGVGFWTLVHRPEFWMLVTSTFRKLDLFPSSGEGSETPTLLGPLERANLDNWSGSACWLLNCMQF